MLDNPVSNNQWIVGYRYAANGAHCFPRCDALQRIFFRHNGIGYDMSKNGEIALRSEHDATVQEVAMRNLIRDEVQKILGHRFELDKKWFDSVREETDKSLEVVFIKKGDADEIENLSQAILIRNQVGENSHLQTRITEVVKRVFDQKKQLRDFQSRKGA